jgi:hypothetical protein
MFCKRQRQHQQLLLTPAITTTWGSSIKCRPNTRHSICVTARAMDHSSLRGVTAQRIPIFRTPRSAPHFTTQPRVQPAPSVCDGLRGDQAIENARSPRHGWKNVSIIENERSAGLGFSIGECPQKIGWWGAKRVEERRTQLTMSAFNLPQFTHIHSRIFLTFTMKPDIVY